MTIPNIALLLITSFLPYLVQSQAIYWNGTRSSSTLIDNNLTIFTSTFTAEEIEKTVTYTATLSTATVTTEGVVTQYTTWCPLTTFTTSSTTIPSSVASTPQTSTTSFLRSSDITSSNYALSLAISSTVSRTPSILSEVSSSSSLTLSEVLSTTSNDISAITPSLVPSFTSTFSSVVPTSGTSFLINTVIQSSNTVQYSSSHSTLASSFISQPFFEPSSVSSSFVVESELPSTISPIQTLAVSSSFETSTHEALSSTTIDESSTFTASISAENASTITSTLGVTSTLPLAVDTSVAIILSTSSPGIHSSEHSSTESTVLNSISSESITYLSIPPSSMNISLDLSLMSDAYSKLTSSKPLSYSLSSDIITHASMESLISNSVQSFSILSSSSALTSLPTASYTIAPSTTAMSSSSGSAISHHVDSSISTISSVSSYTASLTSKGSSITESELYPTATSSSVGIHTITESTFIKPTLTTTRLETIVITTEVCSQLVCTPTTTTSIGSTIVTLSGSSIASTLPMISSDSRVTLISSSDILSQNEKTSVVSRLSAFTTNLSSQYTSALQSTPSSVSYGLSTVTTTSNGIVTVYTTWCPLTTPSSDTFSAPTSLLSSSTTLVTSNGDTAVSSSTPVTFNTEAVTSSSTIQSYEREVSSAQASSLPEATHSSSLFASAIKESSFPVSYTEARSTTTTITTSTKSIVTTTTRGVVTVFTTWCPITTTKIITIESCFDDHCRLSSASRSVSTSISKHASTSLTITSTSVVYVTSERISSPTTVITTSEVMSQSLSTANTKTTIVSIESCLGGDCPASSTLHSSFSKSGISSSVVIIKSSSKAKYSSTSTSSHTLDTVGHTSAGTTSTVVIPSPSFTTVSIESCSGNKCSYPLFTSSTISTNSKHTSKSVSTYQSSARISSTEVCSNGKCTTSIFTSVVSPTSSSNTIPDSTYPKPSTQVITIESCSNDLCSLPTLTTSTAILTTVPESASSTASGTQVCSSGHCISTKLTQETTHSSPLQVASSTQTSIPTQVFTTPKIVFCSDKTCTTVTQASSQSEGTSIAKPSTTISTTVESSISSSAAAHSTICTATKSTPVSSNVIISILTTVTTTSHGVITEYTTWCPLTSTCINGKCNIVSTVISLSVPSSVKPEKTTPQDMTTTTIVPSIKISSTQVKTTTVPNKSQTTTTVSKKMSTVNILSSPSVPVVGTNTLPTCTGSDCITKPANTKCTGRQCDISITSTTPPKTPLMSTMIVTTTSNHHETVIIKTCTESQCVPVETQMSTKSSTFTPQISVVTPRPITTISNVIHKSESTIKFSTVTPITLTSENEHHELVTITKSSSFESHFVTTIMVKTQVPVTSTPTPYTTTISSVCNGDNCVKKAISSTTAKSSSVSWTFTPVVSTYIGSGNKNYGGNLIITLLVFFFF